MRTSIYTSSLMAMWVSVMVGCGDNPPQTGTGQLVISSPSATKTSETGSSVTFTVKLNRAPSLDVIVPVASSNVAEGKTNVSNLTFRAENFDTPQEVRVTGVDDAIKDGDVSYNAVLGPTTSGDIAFSGLEGTVALSNTDNETAGITVSSVTGSPTENGGAASFTVALRSAPTMPVTLQLASSDPTEGTLSVTQLVFTTANYAAPQQVRVTGVNDDLQDGPVAFQVNFVSIASADPNYSGLTLPAPVALTTVDNDTAGVSTTAISASTTEAGGQADFTIVLNTQPTADVTISVASSDTTEGTTDVSSVTFTTANWNAPQTVRVTGVNDDSVDGNQAYRIEFATITSTDTTYAALTILPVDVTNIDDETAGFIVSAASGDTNESAQQATFSVVLTSLPQADVTLSFETSDATEGTLMIPSLTFTPANWNAPQSVTVTGVNDAIADGNQVYQINFTAITSTDPDYMAAALPAPVAFTNLDDETAGITVSPVSGDTTESGGTATFTIALQSEPIADVTVNLNSDDTGEGTVNATALTFTSANWNIAQTVTITGIDDALADGTQPYQIDFTATTSADPNYAGIIPASVDVSNTDNDSAGITVSAISGDTFENGTSATFTVVLNSQPFDTVTVNFASDDLTEGLTTATSLTFTTANWNAPQTVTIVGQNDAVVDGNQPYQIDFSATTSNDAAYAAITPASVNVINRDDDSAGIIIGTLTNGGVTTEAGGTSQFTVVLTSQPTASVTLAFAPSDTTEGTTNVASVTFTTANWNAAQTVTVTGKDDFAVDGNVSYRVVFSASTSTDPNYAGITPAFLSLQNTDNEVADPCNPPSNAELAWRLDVPSGLINWDTQAQVPYGTNNLTALGAATYNRVAYCMTLNGTSVYAEMDDFTGGNLSRVLMPMDHVHDTGVTNLTVVSGSPAVTSVTNATGGKLEMWSNCYGTAPTAVYDYDDDNNFATDCYGSFQVHRDTNTVFAFNRWSDTGALPDLGFGNQVGGSGHPDWTFAGNSASYSSRRITAYIIPPMPKSCKEIIDANPLATSGVYRIDPDVNGSVPALNVYCDMTTNGGGWTLIGKTAAGNYTALTNTQYTDLIANPAAHVNAAFLQTGTAPNAGEMAFYDRATTNALFNVAGGRVVRVQMTNNVVNPAVNGTVFQQRISPPANWDFWGALRDARLWNRDGSVSGSSINFVGTDVRATNNPAAFNPATNTVTHTASTFYGWWDAATLTPTSGGPVNVTRHMGLINDTFGQGWHWLLTANPSDGRWKNDPGFQRSVIWLR